ncbi:putative epidermal cell surface receptor [Neodiprion virginianus]|uniref:putative epidermal cell surface receptor n=1 Tax=Neodiprion virginianus TaxID=2961670 RepID=UPI001EE6D743|nr:putative epidermal cell surface receptor [Neodiprion virginianus]
MLTMKISRRWILQLLVAGSAIYGILAAAHTEESTKATTLNDQRIHPLADNDVPGVRPLRTTVPSHETSREQVHTATAGSDDVLPTYPSSGNQKALATGNVRGNGNEVKYLLPSTVTTTAAYAPSINATRIASEQADSKETRVASSENPAKDGPEFTTESRGRAMQGNSIGVQGEGNTDTRNSLHGNITDLSDVSMDEDDKDIEGGEYLASRNVSGLNFHADASGPVELSPVQGAEVRCTRGNETYAPGSHVYGNCEERCVCSNDGKITDCRPLTCAPPFFRAGREIGDPLCQENSIPGDPCCVAIVCAQDSETEPEEFCYLGNNTVPRGGTVEDGCSQVCVCEARGKLKCRPRCPSNSTSTSMATMMASSANQPDKCVPVPDPRDACCTITLCDVTLGDHEIKSDLPSAEPYDNLTKIEAVNSTAMKLFFSNNTTPQNVTIQLSTDNVLWRSEKLREDSIIGGLEPSRTYYVRVIDGAGNRPIATPLQVNLPGLSNADPATTGIDSKGAETAGVCNHRGTSYKIGAEWYDECISFCTCSGDVQGISPKTECATIECPTDFGLDVLDPNCLDWESVPADFVPVAPRCCSQEVRCKNNGSCLYQDKMYNNWSQIPTSVTGCDKRCYCDMGNVSCQPACPPVPALPPTNLDCPPTHASLRHLPEDKCCLHWVCGNPSEASLPPTIGRNGTSAYPGPFATDSIDQQQPIGDKMIPGISEPIDQQKRTVVQGLSDRYATIPRPKSHESAANLDSIINPDSTDDHGLIHYPMDPGHPTSHTTVTAIPLTSAPPTPPPYHGPYDPNFVPTQPFVEGIFPLTPRTHVKANHPPIQVPKDKLKSRTESKKPVELMKPIKDATAAAGGVTRFAPPTTSEMYANLSELIPTMDKISPTSAAATTSSQDAPGKTTALVSPSDDKSSYTSFSHRLRGPNLIPAAPLNNGVVAPQFQNHREAAIYQGTSPSTQAAGGTTAAKFDGPKTVAPHDRWNDDSQSAARVPVADNRFHLIPSTKPSRVAYLGNSSPNLLPYGPGILHPNTRNLPEELYSLINLRHPGLVRLEEYPHGGDQSLYDTAMDLGAGAEGQREYDGVSYRPGPLQYFNPREITETGGEYDVRQSSELPSEARRHIEKLLLHVAEKDPNLGPFQRYPGGEGPILRSGPPPRGSVPFSLPQDSGQFTRLNHPFSGATIVHGTSSFPASGLDHALPPGFPIRGRPEIQSSSDQITVQTLEAVAEDRIRLVFTVPRILVGLHGRVEVRYTSEKMNTDPSTWKSQIFTPPDDLIATQLLEFELGDLVPSTEYKVMVTVKLRDLSNSPISKIHSVVTLEAENTDVATLPPQIPTDAELAVAETNSTWANIVWRKFTEYELQFIDGVQLRYKEIAGKVYAATPLIHRAVTSYVLENLKPSATYQVEIYFIPFPGQPNELVSEKSINFTTSSAPDPYAFDINVAIKGIKSTEVEVAWKGVPYPEDKYVNIYRAIYQSDTGKEDTSTFKIAKRDSPAKTTIGELKPGTHYRLWIEVYLTNGRIKKSNVQDFVTKPGIPMSAGVLQQQGKLATQFPLHEGDYYGPLVIVAIVASLAILSTLILLMMLMKRRTSSKADISPRKSTAAYDNPSYKTCENATPSVSCNGHEIETETIR